jgi:hypothetical protein
MEGGGAAARPDDGTLSPGYVLRLIRPAAGLEGTLSLLLLLLLVVDRAALPVKLVVRAAEFPPIILKTGILKIGNLVWIGLACFFVCVSLV